jgi:hypothetical protein
MWYTGARLRLASRENDEAKFSVSNPLKLPEAAKESRSRRRGSPALLLPGRGRGWWGLSGPVVRGSRGLPKRSAPHPFPRERGDEVRGEVEGKFSASQSIEIARNRERISETSPSHIPSRFYGARGWGFSGRRSRAFEASGSGAPQPLAAKGGEGKRRRLLNTATPRNSRRARSARPSS